MEISPNKKNALFQGKIRWVLVCLTHIFWNFHSMWEEEGIWPYFAEMSD